MSSNTAVKALPSVAGTAGKPAAPYLQRWASQANTLGAI